MVIIVFMSLLFIAMLVGFIFGIGLVCKSTGHYTLEYIERIEIKYQNRAPIHFIQLGKKFLGLNSPAF